MIIVNGLPLTIITKHSIMDVAAALDPPLINLSILFTCSVIFVIFEIQCFDFYFSRFHLFLTFNEIHLEIIFQEKN